MALRYAVATKKNLQSVTGRHNCYGLYTQSDHNARLAFGPHCFALRHVSRIRMETAPVAERFERHRQPWTQDEVQKLHLLAKKGMPLKAIAKAMTRSEESTKDRAKADGLAITKLR